MTLACLDGGFFGSGATLLGGLSSSTSQTPIRKNSLGRIHSLTTKCASRRIRCPRPALLPSIDVLEGGWYETGVPDLVRIRRALISVSDKRGLDGLALKLKQLGVEVLSTGGTAKALRQLGLSVNEVSDYTGAPEILDGRVKTLHPKVHGGLLGRPTPEHEAEMAKHNIGPIDLVVVNLYPFRETITKPGFTFAEAIENIDIGGPSMLR